MNEAGLLNSMPLEDLKVTCERLERSCQDMRSLLSEFEEEQAMLRQEQNRLHKRVEKAQRKVKGRQERFLDNLLNDMEQLEVSNLLSSIFRAKEEQKAKRRRWTAAESQGGKSTVQQKLQDNDLSGPFSDVNVQLSWAFGLQKGGMKRAEFGTEAAELQKWVREVMSGDPVAEAEALPDAMWAAQLAKRAVESSPQKARHSPSSSPKAPGPGMGFYTEQPSPTAVIRPAVRAPRPDGEASPEHSGAEDPSHFDTLVGLVSNVAGHQVAQQMERSFEAAQHLAQQARAASKARMDGRGSGADMPAAPTFSRRLQEAGAVINFFADWATGKEAELSREGEGEEVYLPRPLPSDKAQARLGEAGSEPGKTGPVSRDARRAKFQEAFSSYLQQKAPDLQSPEKLRAPPISVAPPRAAAPEDPEPPTPPPAPPTREALLQEALRAAEVEEEETVEPCAVPYGVLAQVTSLAGGCVRLSWLFDWESAPDEMSSEEWARRGFEVLCSEEGQEDSEDVKVLPFSKSPAALELPAGQRYRLQVRATLSDSRQSGTTTWTSAPSSAVSADLRAPTSPVKAQASSPVSLDSEATLPNLQVPKAKSKGRVAANFGAFMAAAVPSPSAPNAAAAKVVMGGSVRQQARPDPLVAPYPRVVSAGPVDAASEKAEMAERLRLRGQSGTRETSNTHDSHPRSSSFDSDDESLAKLSLALRSLEKNTVARQKRQLQEVASEAAHQLPERLEVPPSAMFRRDELDLAQGRPAILGIDNSSSADAHSIRLPEDFFEDFEQRWRFLPGSNSAARTFRRIWGYKSVLKHAIVGGFKAYEFGIPRPSYDAEASENAARRAARALQRNLSLVQNHVHRADAQLARYLRQAALLFGLPGGLNSYTTPPLAVGFGYHFDPSDAIILQVEGNKTWELCSRRYPNALSFVNLTYNQVPVDSPEVANCSQIVLREGDAMYLPVGQIHRAQANDELSIHLTMSLNRQFCSASAVLLNVAEQINPSKEFGFAQPNFVSWVHGAAADESLAPLHAVPRSLRCRPPGKKRVCPSWRGFLDEGLAGQALARDPPGLPEAPDAAMLSACVEDVRAAVQLLKSHPASAKPLVLGVRIAGKESPVVGRLPPVQVLDGIAQLLGPQPCNRTLLAWQKLLLRQHLEYYEAALRVDDFDEELNLEVDTVHESAEEKLIRQELQGLNIDELFADVDEDMVEESGPWNGDASVALPFTWDFPEDS
ncbi:unnamed protein product [Symbiodinium natans]|uniref:JmjC domain-containing protein n=1 Tax=Symbiodinium natans TaxID=878477 RepID=A0A812GB82_9DINO|nr:unnamed protein product [Symbiodinium natans]